MAQENLRARYEEDQDYLERLMDLDVTLGGFGTTWARESDDAQMMVGASTSA